MADEDGSRPAEPGQKITLPAPWVEFFMFDSDAPPPEPASPTVGGSLPSRAVQRCPPLTDAWRFPQRGD